MILLDHFRSVHKYTCQKVFSTKVDCALCIRHSCGFNLNSNLLHIERIKISSCLLHSSRLFKQNISSVSWSSESSCIFLLNQQALSPTDQWISTKGQLTKTVLLYILQWKRKAEKWWPRDYWRTRSQLKNSRRQPGTFHKREGGRDPGIQWQDDPKVPSNGE